MNTQSVTVKPDPPRMIRRCAWCPQSPVPDGVVVSHGICAKHSREVEAEFLRAGPVHQMELSEVAS